jgi:hypothetical protein
MADVTNQLDELIGKAPAIEDLTKALTELGNAKSKAMVGGDTASLVNIIKLEKATRQYIETEKTRIDLEERLKKTREGDTASLEQLTKEIEANAEAHKEAEEIITGAAKAKAAAYRAEKDQLEKINAALRQNFRENTLVGQAYTALTGTFGRFTAGLTVGALAMKAWKQHVEAAEVKQEILIHSYRGLGTASQGLGNRMAAAAAFSRDMDKALAGANATAIRMGVSTEYTGQTMAHFARITGNHTPEALKTLTEGAITVSRSLGITVPEAVDFVSTRMDKFGGTAASALSSLNNMRVEAEQTNNAFGRTVVRADDVAKTLLELSKQTNVYAIDQRFVGNILRDNIARLQAQGDSYDLASRKAKAFTEAVTGKAPEWMQVLSGEDITTDFLNNFTAVRDKAGNIIGKELPAEMGDQLEAASPGLKKKVEGVLADIEAGKIGRYEGSRYIQELTAQTEIGAQAMNKQILKLYDGTHGSLITLAKQFGITQTEAAGMVDQAKHFKEITDATNEAEALGKKGTKESIAALAKKLGISKEYAAVIAKDPEAIKETVRQNMKAKDIIAEKKRVQEDIARIEKRRKDIGADIEKLEARKALPIGDKERGLIEAQIKEKKQVLADIDNEASATERRKQADAKKKELAELENKIKLASNPEEKAKLKAKQKQLQKEVIELVGEDPLGTVEKINNELLNSFQEYSDSTGGTLKGMLTELATIDHILMGIAGLLTAKLGARLLFGQRSLDVEGMLAKTFGKKVTGAFTEKGLLGVIADKFKGGGPGGPAGPGTGGFAAGAEKATEGAKKAGEAAAKVEKGVEAGTKASSAVVGGEKAAEGATKAAKSASGAAKGALAVEEAGEGVAKTATTVGKGLKSASKLSKGLKVAGVFGRIAALGFAGKEVYDGYQERGVKGALAKGIPIAAGVAGGVLGGIAGSAAGTLVAPGVGTVLGGAAAAYGAGELAESYGNNLVDYIGLNEPTPAKDTNIAMATKLSQTQDLITNAQKYQATQQQTAGAKPATPTSQTATTGGGPVTGSFVGGISQDGSIMMRVDNFGQAFASAVTMLKRGPKPT